MTAADRQAWRRATLGLLARLAGAGPERTAPPAPPDAAVADLLGVGRAAATLRVEPAAVVWEEASAPHLGPSEAPATLVLPVRQVVHVIVSDAQIAAAIAAGWLSAPGGAPSPRLRDALAALNPAGVACDVRIERR